MGVAGPVDGGGESQKTEVIVGSAGDVITGMVNDGREVPEKKYICLLYTSDAADE